MEWNGGTFSINDPKLGRIELNFKANQYPDPFEFHLLVITFLIETKRCCYVSENSVQAVSVIQELEQNTFSDRISNLILVKFCLQMLIPIEFFFFFFLRAYKGLKILVGVTSEKMGQLWGSI